MQYLETKLDYSPSLSSDEIRNDNSIDLHLLLQMLKGDIQPKGWEYTKEMAKLCTQYPPMMGDSHSFGSYTRVIAQVKGSAIREAEELSTLTKEEYKKADKPKAALLAALKSHLPYFIAPMRVTSSIKPTSKKRRAEDIVELTHVAILDFDGKDNTMGVEEMFDVVSKEPSVMIAFISPSGDGVKALVNTRIDADRFEATLIELEKKNQDADPIKIFRAYNLMVISELAAYYKAKGMNQDPSGKDIARICYIGESPKVYSNEEATPFPLTLEAKTWEELNSKPTATTAPTPKKPKSTKKEVATQQEDKPTITAYGKGEYQRAIIEYLVEEEIVPWRGYDEWLKCICGIRNYFHKIGEGNVGIELARKLSQLESSYNSDEFGKKMACPLTEVDFGSLIFVCTQNGIKLPSNVDKKGNPIPIVLNDEYSLYTTVIRGETTKEYLLTGTKYYRKFNDSYVPEVFQKVKAMTNGNVDLYESIKEYNGFRYVINHTKDMPVAVCEDGRYVNTFKRKTHTFLDRSITKEDIKKTYESIDRLWDGKAYQGFCWLHRFLLYPTEDLVMLLFEGDAAAGKTTFIKIIILLIGAWNVNSVDGSIADKNFTSELETALIYLTESENIDKKELTAFLKNILSGVAKKINEKYESLRDLFQRPKVVMDSNKISRAVLMDEALMRRTKVLRVKAIPEEDRLGEAELMKLLRAEASMVFQYIVELDMTEFNAASRPSDDMGYPRAWYMGEEAQLDMLANSYPSFYKDISKVVKAFIQVAKDNEEIFIHRGWITNGVLNTTTELIATAVNDFHRGGVKISATAVNEWATKVKITTKKNSKKLIQGVMVTANAVNFVTSAAYSGHFGTLGGFVEGRCGTLESELKVTDILRDRRYLEIPMDNSGLISIIEHLSE